MVKQDYVSYLLRLWWTDDGEHEDWRASLQDTRTGERRAFARLDDLLAYLRQRMTSARLPRAADESEGSMPSPGGAIPLDAERD
jgi:hypothetical protein